MLIHAAILARPQSWSISVQFGDRLTGASATPSELLSWPLRSGHGGDWGDVVCPVGAALDEEDGKERQEYIGPVEEPRE